MNSEEVDLTEGDQEAHGKPTTPHFVPLLRVKRPKTKSMTNIKRNGLILLLIIIVIYGCYKKNLVTDPGLHKGKLYHEGKKRTFRYYVPETYNGDTATSLVIVLHGGYGTSKSIIKMTKEKFNTLSEQYGFIVVYPDGIDRHWNDGREGQGLDDKAHLQNIDDVGFIEKLIEHFSTTFNISKNRVFATGISNGGGMAFRLACQLDHKIRGIASVTMIMPVDLTLQCNPLNPTNIMIIHGTDDPLVPYAGGTIQGNRGKVLSAQQTIQFWANLLECDSSIQYNLPDAVPDGTSVSVESKQCNDYKLVFYTINGGGHTWPGGNPYAPESKVGKVSLDIDAAEEIWKFFNQN